MCSLLSEKRGTESIAENTEKLISARYWKDFDVGKRIEWISL